MKGPRRGNTAAIFNLNTVCVPHKYVAPLSLNPAKIKDLREMLPGLVPPKIMDQYWINIIGQVDKISSGNDQADDPEQVDSSSGGDQANDPEQVDNSSNVECEDDPDVMFCHIYDY